MSCRRPPPRYRILCDVELAKDATQQTIVDIWRELPTLRDPDRFEAWAFRMVVHACYREKRRARRFQAKVHLLRGPDGDHWLRDLHSTAESLRTP